MGAVNLLEGVRRVGSANVVIVITTDKVYKNNSICDLTRGIKTFSYAL